MSSLQFPQPGHDRDDAALAAKIPGALDLTGKTSLTELVALLERSKLVIANDSGPMHIAAAAGAPIVALFGPTLPAHFAPWRAKAVLLEKRLACRPCRQRECVSQDFRCLRGIMVEDVLAAARTLL